jgi:signal transduction histidine kinase
MAIRTWQNGAPRAARGSTAVLVAVGCWLSAAWAAADAGGFGTAAAIASSTVAVADEPPPVELEAVVTCCDRAGTLFLQDETGSTFILAKPDNPHLPAGTRVRVRGFVHRGLLINGINATTIESLGTGPPPVPQPITPQLLASGLRHYEWIVIEGIGRAWRPAGDETASLLLNVDGSIVETRLDRVPHAREPLHWIGGRLRVRGIAAGEINDRRQLIRPYLLLTGPEAVELIEPAPADPFGLPESPFSGLGRGEPEDRLQRVSGVVVAVAPRQQVFLSDGEAGLCVQLAAEPTKPVGGVIVGDRVEAVGFAAPGPFATRLVEARLQVVATGQLVVPRRPTANDLFLGCDGQLIEVEGIVTTRDDTAGGTQLLLKLGEISVRVVAATRLPQTFGPLTTVRVTGPCLVTGTTNRRYSLRATGYDLFPRTTADVMLVAATPWWTVRRLTVALAGSLTAGLAAAAWVVLLRRQVRRQLSVIERQIQAEAVAEERQRIAREFHDSLEQDLAGLALRIDSAAGTVADPDARRIMERQREILARLQDETRQYVWDLREPTRLQGSVADRTRLMLDDLQELTDTPLQLLASSPLPTLPPETSHHLLRMLREAITNAAHHAAATRIRVRLDTDRDGLIVTVSDDGTGFDSLGHQQRVAGHFGLRGLRERAKRIGGTLTIASVPGQGTTVTIRLPSGSQRE